MPALQSLFCFAGLFIFILSEDYAIVNPLCFFLVATHAFVLSLSEVSFTNTYNTRSSGVNLATYFLAGLKLKPVNALRYLTKSRQPIRTQPFLTRGAKSYGFTFGSPENGLTPIAHCSSSKPTTIFSGQPNLSTETLLNAIVSVDIVTYGAPPLTAFQLKLNDIIATSIKTLYHTSIIVLKHIRVNIADF